MTYRSTGLQLMTDGPLSSVSGGPGKLWSYNGGPTCTDSSTQMQATGYFAAAGSGGRSGNFGLEVGDCVLLQESTAGATPFRTVLAAVSRSTANQSSLMASSAFNYAMDCTVISST